MVTNHHDLRDIFDPIVEEPVEVFDGGHNPEVINYELSSPMHPFTCKHRLLETGWEPQVVATLQQAAKGVCRVLSYYTRTIGCALDYLKPNYKINIGTGFSISENRMITCRHNTQSSLCFEHSNQTDCTSECETWYLRNVHVTFQQDARRGIDDMSDLYGFCEVQVVQNTSPAMDICFLEMMNKEDVCPSYLTVATEDVPSSFYAVISYPGCVTKELYKEKNLQIPYYKLRSMTAGFNRKVLSRCTNIERSDTITHYCSTIRGSFGAPLINDKGMVVGIHAAGTPSGNFAFSTLTPMFQQEYSKMIS